MAQNSTNLKDAIFQVSDGVLGAGVLIFLGVIAGNWLDSHLHSAPTLTVVLSLLGGGLGLVRLVKKAMLINQSLGSAKPEPMPTTTEDPEITTDRLAPSVPASDPKNGEQQKPKQPKEPKPKSAFEFLDQEES